MAKSRTQQPPPLPPIRPGSWTGEILGAASVHFGQEAQPGPPRQSIEFTYAILPVSLTGPGSRFAWPGVLAIFAPNPLKHDRPDAGTLAPNGALPALHLTLNVTRIQFSDMLPFLGAGRLREFHFTGRTLATMVIGPFAAGAWGRDLQRHREMALPQMGESAAHQTPRSAFRLDLTVPRHPEANEQRGSGCRTRW